MDTLRASRSGRLLTFPAAGRLLVSTDLHGSLADYARLEAIFLALTAAATPEAPAFWLQLGDLVHGPDRAARLRLPDRFPDPDDSPEVLRRYAALQARHPDRVFFALGNHDHAHLGGPICRKFHPDEAAFLEANLDTAGRADLRTVFSGAVLAARACGLLLCHAHPDDTARAWEELDAPLSHGDPRQRRVLEGLLWMRGHPQAVRARLLAQIGCAGLIHGHESAPEGWFSDGADHLCPVIFGAHRPEKRYLLLDLHRRYPDLSALPEGVMLRLHG